MTLLLTTAAAGAGAGICVLARGLTGAGVSDAPESLPDAGNGRGGGMQPTRVRLRGRTDPATVRRAAVALGVGVVALVVTRWPMALPLGAMAVLGTAGLGGRPTAPVIAKLEATATWTEMLRDTLAAASGLTQALVATASIAPLAVRDAVRLLATRISSGVSLEGALRSFAIDLDDPAGDVVVAALLLAATERAQRLSDLLGALAGATREEVAMREAVEASRASARTAVRTITGFSFALVGLMAVFARPYLSPYRSVEGQAVLGVVGMLFGVGLWAMSLMVRPQRLPRLFNGAVA